MAIYYRQQLYQNGVLISTTYLNSDGNPQPTGFTPLSTDIISSTPPPFLPDWANFNRAMISDTGYNRIANATLNQRAVSRLETIVTPAGYTDGIDNKDYPLVKACWDLIVTGLPLLNKVNAAEIAAWNAIASAAFMQFKFDSDGKMVLI
ncbi:hypothetical protein [Nostoc sp. TCL240-02]|uniref:hypothetical protein n=1 Tax=Nostoc sp. TCL240-02 TaxID=2572090 RepID=UPI00157FBB94|nr:hypothetical protein [Nostoc sp. TCL240-02]QKQ75577.1 hypothetical protein FBB35_21850 [Nostoc sp. TCL240-02]